MHPADEGRRGVEMVEFAEHLVELDGAEGRAKVTVTRGIQVLKESMGETCHSILSSSFGFIYKLVRI